MDVNYLCLSIHLDISNKLKKKYIGNTGQPIGNRGNKVKFGNPHKFGFPNDSLCAVITMGNSLIRLMELLS